MTKQPSLWPIGDLWKLRGSIGSVIGWFDGVTGWLKDLLDKIVRECILDLTDFTIGWVLDSVLERNVEVINLWKSIDVNSDSIIK